MDALLDRIALAKTDIYELECLISDYMPFIKRTVHDAGNLGLEYDDRLSLAMLSFMNCVKQYEIPKGGFVAFAAACIRNRLIDESRKQIRYAGKVMPLFPDNDSEKAGTVEYKISIAIYDKEQEQRSLSDETDALSAQLKEFGIAFAELPRICPKQKRSCKQCISLGRAVADSKKMRENLLKNHRISQAELAHTFEISEKTIEKHRKYIVTITILLTGDYPLIRAFLPQYKEM